MTIIKLTEDQVMHASNGTITVPKGTEVEYTRYVTRLGTSLHQIWLKTPYGMFTAVKVGIATKAKGTTK